MEGNVAYSISGCYPSTCLAGLNSTSKIGWPTGRESEAQFLTPQPQRNWRHAVGPGKGGVPPTCGWTLGGGPGFSSGTILKKKVVYSAI
jgi:hypothetical protein